MSDFILKKPCGHASLSIWVAEYRKTRAIDMGYVAPTKSKLRELLEEDFGADGLSMYKPVCLNINTIDVEKTEW